MTRRLGSCGSDRRPVILISGIQAAGKTTVAHLLAERVSNGIVIEGDHLGGVPGTGVTTEEYEQLREDRYRRGAALADDHHRAGKTPIHADSIWGAPFVEYENWVTARPLLRVMLIPSVAKVAAHVRSRGYGYDYWKKKGMSLEEGIRDFLAGVVATPRVGLWIDTSELTADQTVDQILAESDLALE